jgi:hypothetical protein
MRIEKRKTNVFITAGLQDCKYMDIAHIYKLYAMSTETERNTDWYADAYTFAKNLSVKYNISIIKIAHLIAAISPQQKWEKNKEMAIISFTSFRRCKKWLDDS